MTPEEMATVSGTAGMLISLIFNLTPRLRQRFDLLTSAQQQVAMGVMMLAVAIVINLYQCLDPDSLTCTDGFSWRRIGIFGSTLLAGIVSNQSTDRITPKPEDKTTKKSVARKRVRKGLPRAVAAKPAE